MTLLNWLRSRSTKTTPRPRTRLEVQQLEARDVPSWLVQIGGTSGELPWASNNAVGADGTTYLSGWFASTPADFDPGAGTTPWMSSAGDTDGFVAKYTPEGALAWARRLGGTMADAAAQVSLDPTGSYLYVTGRFAGSADFTGDNVPDLTSAGDGDAFVLKLNATTGGTEWVRGVGGDGADGGDDIAVGSDGFVYTTGNFSNKADFDPAPTTTYYLTATGKGKNRNLDPFILKLNSAGNFVSAWQFGGEGIDRGKNLVVDGNTVYLQGTFHSTADFDPGPTIRNRTSAGQGDIFLASYTTSGSFNWVQTLGNTYDEGDWSWGLGSDATALYLTGSFEGTLDFDPGSGTAFQTSAGATDAVIGKFSKQDGALVRVGGQPWAYRFGSTGSDTAADSVIDPATGAVYVGGGFYNTVDFNPGGPGGELSSAGSADSFLLKLDASANYLNAWRMGGPDNDSSLRLRGVRNGTVYFATYFNGTADFPNGAALTSAGLYDIALMALDDPATSPLGPSAVAGALSPHQLRPLLNEARVHWQAGGADVSSMQGIDVRIADLGGSTLGLAPGNTPKLDADGNHLASWQVGGPGDYNDGWGIAVDSSGLVSLTRSYSGSVDFDPDPLGTDTLTSIAISLYLAKLRQN